MLSDDAKILFRRLGWGHEEIARRAGTTPFRVKGWYGQGCPAVRVEAAHAIRVWLAVNEPEHLKYLGYRSLIAPEFLFPIRTQPRTHKPGPNVTSRRWARAAMAQVKRPDSPPPDTGDATAVDVRA